MIVVLMRVPMSVVVVVVVVVSMMMMLTGFGLALIPRAPVFALTASMRRSLRPVKTTWCPAARASSTSAAPMPWLPPVIRNLCIW